MSRKNKKKEDGSSKKDSSSVIWLTVYCDMMTNLMLFFLMLYATTRMHAEARQRVYEAFQAKFDETKSKIKDDVKEEEVLEETKNVTLIEETEERIKITLPSPVLFDSGKSELKSAANPVLRQIARKIKEHNYPVIIEGHTDNDPIVGGQFPSNWHLSAARAFSVLRYFVGDENINPKRFSALGHAEFNPVASNDTNEGKSKNRRIAIIMVKK